jgi:transglutaminase-like putative cysteine protease
MVDPRAVDWSRVEASSYAVRQVIHYEYPEPVSDLRQRLVMIPPRQHGDQRCVSYRLRISSDTLVRSTRRDPFGNVIVELQVPRVEGHIDFEAQVVLERRFQGASHVVPESQADILTLLQPSLLTTPDDTIRRAAMTLMAEESDGFRLAELVNRWVFERMRYEPGVTTVRTTAAEALAGGAGVCQDYAHLMIAICRACGLAARYVSGHLVGEGAMHAWVEVLLPCNDGSGDAIAWAFDPTHGRKTSLRYLSVAVGRDFADVSPTRGVFRSAAPGTVSSDRSVVITDVRYREAGASA